MKFKFISFRILSFKIFQIVFSRLTKVQNSQGIILNGKNYFPSNSRNSQFRNTNCSRKLSQKRTKKQTTFADLPIVQSMVPETPNVHDGPHTDRHIYRSSISGKEVGPFNPVQTNMSKRKQSNTRSKGIEFRDLRNFGVRLGTHLEVSTEFYNNDNQANFETFSKSKLKRRELAQQKYSKTPRMSNRNTDFQEESVWASARKRQRISNHRNWESPRKRVTRDLQVPSCISPCSERRKSNFGKFQGFGNGNFSLIIYYYICCLTRVVCAHYIIHLDIFTLILYCMFKSE